jgi:hypothetical protein
MKTTVYFGFICEKVRLQYSYISVTVTNFAGIIVGNKMLFFGQIHPLVSVFSRLIPSLLRGRSS